MNIEYEVHNHNLDISSSSRGTPLNSLAQSEVQHATLPSLLAATAQEIQRPIHDLNVKIHLPSGKCDKTDRSRPCRTPKWDGSRHPLDKRFPSQDLCPSLDWHWAIPKRRALLKWVEVGISSRLKLSAKNGLSILISLHTPHSTALWMVSLPQWASGT